MALQIPLRDKQGNLTDYGKRMQVQEEAKQIASTYKRPDTFKPELGQYGGFNPTYEAYVAENIPRGNMVLSRDEWQRDINKSREPEFERNERQQPSLQGLQQTKNQQKIQNMKNVFDKMFQMQKSEIESQRQGLTPRFRTERANIGTADTMSRARTEAIQAGQGLSGAGAASQSDIAQNVITQGALSQSRATEAEQNRLLDQALLQAGQQRDLGIAQEQLAEQRLQDERAYQQQLLNQQIAREDALRLQEQQRQDALLGQQRADTLQAQERDQYIQTIGRFAQDFTAEINRLRGSGDPTASWKIPLLEQARQQKIVEQGLDPATGQPLPQGITQDTLKLAQWKVSNNIPLTDLEAQALGVRSGYTAPRTGGGGGLSSSSQASLAKWKYDNNLPLTPTESSILGLPAGFQQGQTEQQQFLQQASDIINPVTIDNVSVEKRRILERLINTPELYSEPNQLQAILEDQGISIQELEAYEDWRDRALADRPFQ